MVPAEPRQGLAKTVIMAPPSRYDRHNPQEERPMIRALSLVLVVVLAAGCAAHVSSRPEAGSDDQVGADAVNIWYVPGRALGCAASAIMSFITLTVTFGQEYETVSEIMHGGCSGPWSVPAQEVRNAAQ